MDKPSHPQTGSLPTHLPQTAPPQEYVMSDHTSFILQAIMEMQNKLGQLEQAVKTLTEVSSKNGTKLDEISHKVYAAQVTIYVVGSVFGLGVLGLFWKYWTAIPPHP